MKHPLKAKTFIIGSFIAISYPLFLSAFGVIFQYKFNHT